METGKTNNTEGNKTTTQTNTGFDISSLLSNQNIAELLKHLLSAGGAMMGDYFIWIKPLQEKVEAMNKTIMEQDSRIKELERERNKEDRSPESENQNFDVSKGGYLFKTKRKQPQMAGYEGSRNKYL